MFLACHLIQKGGMEGREGGKGGGGGGGQEWSV